MLGGESGLCVICGLFLLRRVAVRAGWKKVFVLAVKCTISHLEDYGLRGQDEVGR